jgi:phage terminase large subunit-like protein
VIEAAAVNPWRTALPDWEERILAGRSLVPDLPLFRSEADRALRVFNRLRVPDLIGMPTMAEACGPWFLPIVEAMFGSYDPETHRRMIQEYFLLIPKGNAKSSNGGALMVTALIMNRRPEGEFDLIAPTLKIAGIAFNQAKGTIKADPELDKLFQCRDHIRTIEHRTNGSKLQIKAADTDVVTGGKAVGTMIDETHVLASKNKAEDIFTEIRGALGKRPDGFLLQATTQAKAPPVGQFKAELERARSVRDGKIDLPLLPILYEFPNRVIESEEWKTERKLWTVVNPNLGRSLDLAFLERELGQALQGDAGKLALFASQHFNIEIGLRMRSDRWRAADHWEGSADPTLGELDAMLDRCEVAVAGIDGGGEDDLLGLCIAGRERLTGRWLFWHHAWAWPDVLERRKDIAAELRDFAGEGDVTICDEDSRLDADVLAAALAAGESFEAPLPQDMAELVAIIARVKARGLFPAEYAVAVDKVGSPMLVDALANVGVIDPQVYGQGQGYMLNAAIATLPRMLKDGRALHGGRRMMAWCVSNAKVTYSGSALVMTKQAAGSMKIDPVIAMLNAFLALARGPEAAQTESVYATRGLRIL